MNFVTVNNPGFAYRSPQLANYYRIHKIWEVLFLCPLLRKLFGVLKKGFVECALVYKTHSSLYGSWSSSTNWVHHST